MTTAEPPPASGSASVPASGTGPARGRRKSRWRRRLKRTFLVLLALVVVLRVSLVFIIPIVVRRAADAYGLTCTYDRLDMNLLATDLGLWRLTLTPKQGGAAVARVEYIRADISPFALLRGKLHVRRAEADGVDLVFDRDANGRIPWLEPLLRKTSPPPPQPAASNKPLRLSSPLQVDAFRLRNVHTRFLDQSVLPALDTLVRLNVSVSDLGDPVRPTRFEVELLADSVLDYLRVEGEAKTAETTLEADWRVLMRGVHPRPVAGYLRAFGIEPRAKDIGVRMSGRAQVRVLTSPALPNGMAPPPALAGNLTIHDVAVIADGRESLGLNSLTVEVDRFTGTSAQLAGVTIDGLTCRAERGADGNLRVAGFDLVGAAPAAAPATQPAIAMSVSAAGPARPPMAWGIKELDLRAFRAEFHDEAVTPAADLALVLDEMVVHNLGVDPSQADAVVDLTGRGHAPGLARALKMTASVKPSATPAVLDAQLSAEGIEPDALQPYLERLGLESQLGNAGLSCNLRVAWQKHDGRLACDVGVEHIDFRDEATLFSSEGARVTGAEFDPRNGAMRVQAIDIRGPHFSVRREPSGALAFLGLRTKVTSGPAAPRAESPPATRPARAQGDALASLPPIAIGRFSWKGVNIRWQDDMVRPAVALEIADAGVEMANVDWDPARPDAAAKSAGFHAWLAVPGLLGNLDAQGSLTPGTSRVRAEMAVTAQGVTGQAIAPYLKPAGIEPLVSNGELRLHGLLTVAKTGREWGFSLDVDDAGLADNGQELVGMDRLSVQDVVQRPGEIGVAGVEIVRPRLCAERDADGTLIISGIRLLPATAPPQAAPADAAGVTAVPQVTTLSHLAVQEASLSWTDHAVTPVVATSATATVELDGLTLGAPAPPATMSLTARVPGSVEELTATGTVSAAPDAPAIALAITGKGMRAGPLSAYVPAGVRVTMQDGSVRAAVNAGVEPNPLGGRRAHVQVTDLLLSDAPGAPPGSTPLLKLDAARLAVSRWDPGAGILAVDEVSAGGLEMDVEQTSNKSICLLGLTLGPDATGTSAPTPSAETSVPGPVVAQGAASPEALAQVQARIPPEVPLITLERLDLQIRRLSFHDGSRPAAAPLSLADLRLRNIGRVECLGADASSRPATKLQLTSRIDPLVDRVAVDVVVAPFGSRPSLQVSLLASGIQGQGLTALVPEIKPNLDGSPLTAGELQLFVELEGKWPRRVPWDFDLARGADLWFLIKDVAFRDSPGGPVLLGLNEMRGEGVQILSSGRGVHVRSLELTSPTGRLWRDQAGLHILGCTLPLPTAAAEPTSEPQAHVAALPQEASETHAPTTQPRPEFSIDRLTIAGVDLLLEDRSFTPQLTIPLTGLDVEVRDVTTLALTENRPLRFSVLANSGKVTLPRRSRGGGVPGAMGDAFNLLAGTHTEVATGDTENRELFAQVTGSGKIGLYPAPNGWAKLALNGLDLAAFSGAAKAQGVTLDGGIFDFSADIRFRDNGDLDARTRSVFTDLRMAEPPNGPIVRYLALPAPLDAVIGALQDADGSITLLLNVPMERGEISMSKVQLSAIGAVSRVVVRALASAPLKAAAGVGSLVGLTSGRKAVKQEQIVFDFAPGATALAAGDAARLQEVARRMRGDERIEASLRHELGMQDIPIAQSRANPNRDECLALAHQLQQRRTELTANRQHLAGEGQAQLASAAPERFVTLEHLRRVNAELAQTDDALDRLYDLSRPGADRQAKRRTRAAALDIGQERLETVREQLAGADAEEVANRLHVIRATVNPAPEAAGGRVTITLIEPRKSRGLFPLGLLSDLFRAGLRLVSSRGNKS